jgi:hypothetical protein
MNFTNQGPKPGPDPAAARLSAVGAALDAGQLPSFLKP